MALWYLLLVNWFVLLILPISTTTVLLIDAPTVTAAVTQDDNNNNNHAAATRANSIADPYPPRRFLRHMTTSRRENTNGEDNSSTNSTPPPPTSQQQQHVGFNNQRKTATAGKILGGNQVIASTIPSQESLYPYFATTLGDLVCGASLIHSDILLTAAHCNDAFDSGIVLNTKDRNQLDVQSIVNYVIHRHVHPNYNNMTMENDLQLIKLRYPIDSQQVQPIGYTSNVLDPIVGTNVTVIGFGRTQWTSDISQYLRETTIPTRNCTKEKIPTYESSIMFCAGKQGMDACQGDSGGPALMKKVTNSSSASSSRPASKAMQTNDNDYDAILVGLVSYHKMGTLCGDDLYPAVYTRIGPYHSWIQQTICSISSHPSKECRTNYAASPSSLSIQDKNKNTSITTTATSGSSDTAPSLAMSSSTSSSSFTVQEVVPVFIRVQNDDYPNETYWELYTQNGTFVTKQKPIELTNQSSLPSLFTSSSDTGGDDNSTDSSSIRGGIVQTQVVALIPGESYRLALSDTGGDGNCCSYGQGSFTIYTQLISNYHGNSKNPSKRTVLNVQYGNFFAYTGYMTFTVPLR